jgi:hypothetical protein
MNSGAAVRDLKFVKSGKSSELREGLSNDKTALLRFGKNSTNKSRRSAGNRENGDMLRPVILGFFIFAKKLYKRFLRMHKATRVIEKLICY